MEKILLKRLIVGQLQTNCFLLSDKKTHNCLIIDPGDDAEYIIDAICKEKLSPKLILATHGHFDHIMASYSLKSTFNIPFLMNKKDEFLLKRMQSTAKYFLKIKSDPPPLIDRHIKNGDVLKIGDCKLEIIGTPGHTPGSISFYCNKEKTIFVGDLIFADGNLGRTDLSYSSTKVLKTSVSRILTLPPNTKILSGHGKPSLIASFKKRIRKRISQN